MSELLRKLLDEVLVTHAPPGQEEEMVAVVRPHLEEHCDEVWQDAHLNLIGKIAGETDEGAIIIATHKDEVATMVERVDEDGKVLDFAESQGDIPEVAVYAHASAGCLHVRPLVNTKTARGVELMQVMGEYACDLAVSFARTTIRSSRLRAERTLS